MIPVGCYAPAFVAEGARTADRRGETIWDRRVPLPAPGQPDPAGGSDSYRRSRDDLALARDLGLAWFGLSIAWTRILPEGTGRPSPVGLDHYDRLLDDVLDAGLVPVVALYHWDLPQALEARGGLALPDAPSWLGALAEHVVRRLGDRLDVVLTVCEPQVQAFRGHVDGSHAPGTRDWRLAVRALDGLLRGHAAMAAAIRASGRGLRVGALLDRRVVEPATDREADVDAAARVDAWANRAALDVLLGRGWPADLVEALGPELLDPYVVEAAAGAPADLDLLAVRAHRPEVIASARAAPLDATLAAAPPTHVTGAAIRDVVVDAAAAAPGTPLLVVGSSQGFVEEPGADGVVDDGGRAGLVVERIEAVEAAARAGAPVEAHLLWTLVDGYDWGGPPSGLVRHDPWTGARTPKRSARALAALLGAG